MFRHMALCFRLSDIPFHGHVAHVNLFRLGIVYNLVDNLVLVRFPSFLLRFLWWGKPISCLYHHLLGSLKDCVLRVDSTFVLIIDVHALSHEIFLDDLLEFSLLGLLMSHLSLLLFWPSFLLAFKLFFLSFLLALELFFLGFLLVFLLSFLSFFLVFKLSFLGFLQSFLLSFFFW